MDVVSQSSGRREMLSIWLCEAAAHKEDEYSEDFFGFLLVLFLDFVLLLPCCALGS